MRKIKGSASLLVHLDSLEFTEAALSAEEETAGLALTFGSTIADWEDIAKRERTGRRAVTRADALVNVLDARLDEVTTRFSGVLLVEAKQDRKSTFFKRFFPNAPSELVRANLRKQCEQTRDRILPELAKLDADSPLRAFETPLREAMQATLDALDARAKVRAERASVASDVADWKDGVNRLRTTTYAELLKLTATGGHAKSWADAFFPSSDNTDSDEPTPTDPPL